jgi:2-polyprenyl-3-methyl-5-hydroxy-6-metoxy-1,4-benzoquinol methylase/uncharacterized protein YbaR (Trm112 family)
MHEASLEFLRCIRCGSKLELEVFKKTSEIDEGILTCSSCNLCFPIVKKIPILWNDLSKYLSERTILGEKLYNSTTSEKLKKFLKNSLSHLKPTTDRSLEEKWAKIYYASQKSKFYSIIKEKLKTMPKSKLVLEHGCSIGIISSFLADSNQTVFGIDRSYSAISLAKKIPKPNLDYFVADSLSPVFGKTKFDLIVALNLLEIIEPIDFIKHISEQISKGYLVLSDPYDFDRGEKSVKTILDESSLRAYLKEIGFSLSIKTKKPSFIQWNLLINNRTTLNYKVDFIIAKKV